MIRESEPRPSASDIGTAQKSPVRTLTSARSRQLPILLTLLLRGSGRRRRLQRDHAFNSARRYRAAVRRNAGGTFLIGRTLAAQGALRGLGRHRLLPGPVA